MAEPASTPTTPEVLEDVLSRAVEDGDRIASGLRVLLGGLTILRIGATQTAALLAGDTKYWTVILILLAGIGLPSLVRALARHRLSVRVRATASVLADPLIVLAALLPMLIWPHPDYRGCLREIDTAFFCLSIAGTGLRMSRRVVVAGTVANVAAFAALLGLDVRLNSPQVLQISNVVIAAIILIGSACLAVLIAARARRLLFDGSRAALLAERARQRLGIFVSEEVADEVLTTPTVEVGGSRREVAVLFTDLRGFTRYSEKLSPEHLVRELNGYFEAMGAEIRKESGVIDKYIGDSIMAVFGLREGPGAAASQALRAAAGMQAALEAHNARRAAEGKPPLRHGIGVHFGSVIAGNIGTENHMQRTVVGDVVNLASRLESATKDLGVPVVVSGEAVAAAGAAGPPVRACGRIEVRGRVAPVDAYTLADSVSGSAAAPAAPATPARP